MSGTPCRSLVAARALAGVLAPIVKALRSRSQVADSSFNKSTSLRSASRSAQSRRDASYSDRAGVDGDSGNLLVDATGCSSAMARTTGGGGAFDVEEPAGRGKPEETVRPGLTGSRDGPESIASLYARCRLWRTREKRHQTSGREDCAWLVSSHSSCRSETELGAMFSLSIRYLNSPKRLPLGKSRTLARSLARSRFALF
jgi:hypothetical protein